MVVKRKHKLSLAAVYLDTHFAARWDTPRDRRRSGRPRRCRRAASSMNFMERSHCLYGCSLAGRRRARRPDVSLRPRLTAARRCARAGGGVAWASRRVGLDLRWTGANVAVVRSFARLCSRAPRHEHIAGASISGGAAPPSRVVAVLLLGRLCAGHSRRRPSARLFVHGELNFRQRSHRADHDGGASRAAGRARRARTCLRRLPAIISAPELLAASQALASGRRRRRDPALMM
jgi:hypothetical protein